MNALNPFATIDELRIRTTEAIIGQSGLNHAGLNAEIRRRFASEDWREGGVIQEPVLEAALPYVAANETLDDLAGNLLHPTLVDALDGSDAPNRPYRFRRTQNPYAHQLEAWRWLGNQKAARSVLVTSGTGSGKTECFLVPILNDLAHQAATAPHALQGVQAIMLYPLNALIASQEERLRAWTEPFNGKIRFALYNGMMPEELKAAEASARPEKVADRKRLRAAPPPILVTNATMLEYMLLRPQDAPILAASQGKLRYVVLDEAHSYVGAQAAEIALLLRRVCLAFGVKPTDVRFIATSATIGAGEDIEASLGKFLADVSGAARENVSVIRGRQKVPTLPPLHSGGPIGAEAHYAHLGGHPAIRPLLEKLYEGPVPWSVVKSVAEQVSISPASLALKLANALSTGLEGETLAPLRVHSFHRATPGLWSCLDPSCSRTKPADWPFGAIHHQPAEICGCGAPLFEIVACSSCGEAFLDVVETPTHKLVAPLRGAMVDEFALDADTDATETDEDREAPAPQIANDRKLIALKSHTKGVAYRWLCVEAAAGIVHDGLGAPGVTTFAAYDRMIPEICPACAVRGGDNTELIRPIRFGAPFILGNATPILLAGAAHPDEAADSAHWVDGAPPPLRGRQLLSFTDSRQGTARLAAKLQIASERNHVRSVIYHSVQDALAQGADANKVAELEATIVLLRDAVKGSPGLQSVLAKQEAERTALDRQGEAGLPWDEMVQRLAERSEVRVWMKRVWGRRATLFENEMKLAEFLLLREFIRRPPRANSPETLGLARLRFEAIDKIPNATVPGAFIELGGTPADWRDLLHLLVTFIARGRSAVRVANELLQWVPPPGVRARELVANPQRALAGWEVLWPQFGATVAGRLPVVVQLLEQVLERSLDDRQVRDGFQDIFSAAWLALGELLATPGATSRQLSFAKAHVAPVTTAWFCPVSRRLLDVTLRGISPYGAKVRGSAPMPAIKMRMPRHPLPFVGQREALPEFEAQAIVRDWLENDPSISKLRRCGAWGDINDRIALFSEYFRSAEHSAQQQPARLRRYEGEFKSGAINVLNCSTTMEMGVDIGSVSHVMMTNLPPHIANYRQRVGRAGRRGQPLSMAFTFCKDKPLDRDAFREPARYLRRDVRAPHVALSSRVIVQRHVNALLFGEYMRAHGGNAMKLQAGAFFGCGETIGAVEDSNNAAKRMADWMRAPWTRETLRSQIGALVRSSVLADDPGVYDASALALEQARAAFSGEWLVIQTLAAGVGASDKAARTRLEIHLRRLTQDFVLRVLASRGFLPSHGFPTDVVSFVIRKESMRTRDPSEPEDNNRFNAYPQRSLDSAIREYAPGSEVVVDGLVHKSAGVTLNWKQPASEAGVREIQALMWRWRCRACGESGTIRHFDPGHVDCPACNAGNVHWFEYLQPAGFAVDLRAEPHADADVVTYVPPEPTSVSAAGALWIPLFDPARGRRRAAREGSVFFCNAGPDGDGYAICLSCGRADAPAGQSHSQLLGSGECSGALKSFARKDELRLAHEIHTDVFEFQPAGWPQSGGAIALAVALREALARRLGVAPDEMGLGAERRRDQLGGLTTSIFLHDNATGGAGFAIQADHLFPEIVSDAEAILDCKVPGCITACPSCVLVGDLTDDQVRDLDRRPALDLIRHTLLADAAPDPNDRPTPDAKFSRDLFSELSRALEGGGARMTLRLSSPIDAGELEAWSAASLIERWRGRGKHIVLALDVDAIERLDGAQKLRLRDFVNRWGLHVETGEPRAFANGAQLVAEVVDQMGRTTVFATRDTTAVRGGEAWGRPTTAPVVRFSLNEPSWAGALVTVDNLREDPGAVVIHIARDLDGPIGDFGAKAASKIREMLTRVGVPADVAMVALEYEDRYVRSPLTMRLLIDSLRALSRGAGKAVPVTIKTIPLELKDQPPRFLDNDWKSETDRAAVVVSLAAANGLTVDWRPESAGHARRLTATLANGRRVQILFDQGLGPWRANRGASFDFRSPPVGQASRLRRFETTIQIGSGGHTYLVAEMLP